MPTYDGGVSATGGAGFILRLITSENTDPSGNSSTVNYTLRLVRTSGFAFNLNANSLSWSTNIGGKTNSGATSYDFRAYSELDLVSTTTSSIAHDPDGSKTISVSGSVSGPGPIQSGSTSGSMTLTDYSRPPLAPASCTVSVSGRNATVTSGTADVTDRPAITSYQVEATTNDGSTWSGTVNTMDGSRQYVYTSLDGGKYYKFRTRAVNSDGAGAWTESSSTFIPAGGKRWDGASWQVTTIAKRWDGSAWVDLTIAKRWDGSAWVDLS